MVVIAGRFYCANNKLIFHKNDFNHSKINYDKLGKNLHKQNSLLKIFIEILITVR